MQFTPEDEAALLALFRGDGPKPLTDPTEPPEPVEPTPAPVEPHVWTDAPVIDMQANNPTGTPEAEIRRRQNMARSFGGDSTVGRMRP